MRCERVVEQREADLREPAFEFGAEGLVDERAAHLRIGARQPAVREQSRSQCGDVVFHPDHLGEKACKRPWEWA